MTDHVRTILKEFGETDSSNVWTVQNATVIKHACLERVAAKASITFDPPQVLRAERDEAVILVTGKRGQRVEWSIGEALVNVNYRVTGKMAAYVYAMAEKRAKDRVVLKLINLHGLAYSEDEADDFRDSGQAGAPPADDPFTDPPPNLAALLHAVGLQETAESLNAWGVESKAAIGRLPKADADRVRGAFATKLKALKATKERAAA